MLYNIIIGVQDSFEQTKEGVTGCRWGNLVRRIVKWSCDITATWLKISNDCGNDRDSEVPKTIHNNK